VILIDLSHTSHTTARTGVQRVSRSLYEALPVVLKTPPFPITWDPYARAWRHLRAEERLTLANETPSSGRGSDWSLRQRLQGWAFRGLRRPPPLLPPSKGLIVPEIFSPAVGRSLPELMDQVSGPRVALFHDAIALKLPELSAAKTVARFPAYLRELLQFDGVAAVSEDSRDALREWWRWLGATRMPPVLALPLGIHPAGKDTVLARTTAQPVALSVGTLEGRKNHLALLEACEHLWSQGHAFELRLIGLAHPQTGAAALARLRRLQQSGRALRYDGPVDERALQAAYHECSFTVYPSLMEGFGLPVLESLNYGKPCICSSRGALGESARGGGCLTLDQMDANAIAGAISVLLTQPGRKDALAQAARSREFKRWPDYARELLLWMETLPHDGHLHR